MRISDWSSDVCSSDLGLDDPALGHTDRMARVTLQTIADRVGVSRMTVSNAFSRPDQLPSDLRDQILAAAQALGYVGPDPAARALARQLGGASCRESGGQYVSISVVAGELKKKK